VSKQLVRWGYITTSYMGKEATKYISEVMLRFVQPSHSVFSNTTAPYRFLLRILVTIELPEWYIADSPIIKVNFCVPRRPIFLEHLGYKVQIILV